MSLIENKSSDLSEEVEDGVPLAEKVDNVSAEKVIEERSEESPANQSSISNEAGTAESTSAVFDVEPEIAAGINDITPAIDQPSTTSSSPSPSTPSPVASLSTSCTQETQTTESTTTATTSRMVTSFVGPVQGPSINVYSPYIEDHREMSIGPNVFEKNIRNAIESRQQENADTVKDANEKDPDDRAVQVTPNNGNVLETDSNGEHDELPVAKAQCATEQTDPSAKKHGCPDQTGILVEEHSDKDESKTSAEADDNLKQDDILFEASCNEEKTEDDVSNKDQADTPVEAENNKEVADSSVEVDSAKEAAETKLPTEDEQPKEVETQTESEDPRTYPADAETLAQAKEWHDSIVRRVARLRGLSSWLGERNKRMDGMVEILVRSLEHMGVGAVTDHIGNLIPLQNFRLNSAIKLSSVENTWTACDDAVMSNDINDITCDCSSFFSNVAWLPDSAPDDHNLSLTNEQMRKYESQVEALRAENECLQRSLQTALDNQGSLGVQISQWQACIDSAGQQLSRVTQEVHESKSRERHLRRLLGEERRIKDSLVQQNSMTKAVQQDHTAENVNCWPQSDGLGGPSHQSATLSTGETSATFVQDRQHAVGNVAFNNYTGSPSQAQTTVEASTVPERVLEHGRALSYGPRDTRSSRLNSSAPPFVSAYASPQRHNYRGNWRTGSNWHSRSGSGRNFGSAAGRGRRSSGRGYYRKEHSTNAGFNRLLDGFFDNLNRIENALRQQGINVPGPTSDAPQVVQQQQPQQVISSNVTVQYPATVQDLQQQQTVPNQAVYYSQPMQTVVYEESEYTVAQPVQSIPSMQQVPQSPTVVQAIQPHVQFAQVEGQAY